MLRVIWSKSGAITYRRGQNLTPLFKKWWMKNRRHYFILPRQIWDGCKGANFSENNPISCGRPVKTMQKIGQAAWRADNQVCKRRWLDSDKFRKPIAKKGLRKTREKCNSSAGLTIERTTLHAFIYCLFDFDCCLLLLPSIWLIQNMMATLRSFPSTPAERISIKAISEIN